MPQGPNPYNIDRPSPELRNTDLGLLQACRDSRATVLKTYSVRHLPQLDPHPFFISPTSDALLIADPLVAYRFRESVASATGITRLLGLSLGACRNLSSGHPPDGRPMTFQRMETSSRSDITLSILCNLIEAIETLDRVVVYLPSCHNTPTQAMVVDMLRWKWRPMSHAINPEDDDEELLNWLPFRVPEVTFQKYECSLDAQEIENRLQKHMESLTEEV